MTGPVPDSVPSRAQDAAAKPLTPDPSLPPRSTGARGAVATETSTRPVRPSRLRRWARPAATVLLAIAALLLLVIGVVWQRFPVPIERLEQWPTSPVVSDRDGQTLLQLVGTDDQWRLPVPLDKMSPWLIRATVAAEDERFWSHPGIDPIALTRAVGQNLRSGSIVSGASTLTMQLCRMLDDQPRTLSAKIIEATRALQLERVRSKSEIIAAYLNVAPYGGNIRGVEAAARFYFGKRAADLSLGEAALLAGIPQRPSRLRPDVRLDRALKRRDYVLQRMHAVGFISATEREQAQAAPIQIRRERLEVPSQVAWLALQRRPRGGRTTVDSSLQQIVESAVTERLKRLPSGSDIAVAVIDIQTSEIRALVGSADPDDPVDGQVNGVIARRSPGSALKPFVYAAAFEARRLRPDSIVADDPETFADWTPDNFDREFAGRLTAAEALRASRNIPAIHIAQTLGLERCIGVLAAAGVALPADADRRGGLTLAVGGIEVTLLELTNAYATLGRNGECRTPRLFLDEESSEARLHQIDSRSECLAPLAPLGRGAGGEGQATDDPSLQSSLSPKGRGFITGGERQSQRKAECGFPLTSRQEPSPQRGRGENGHGFAALSPDVCAAINDILSSRRKKPVGSDASSAQLPWFMWKTGTSSGRRDAWAIGHNHRFAIGVWVGRFSGVGHHDFVGRDAAEPLLTRLFCHPSLRQTRDPRPPEFWAIRDPLPLPNASVERPGIVSPLAGEVFISVQGRSVVHPQTNVSRAARPESSASHWFLNGQFLGHQKPERLELEPGSYELRWITDNGRASATNFRVE